MNNDKGMLIYGIIAGAIISLSLFWGAILVYESTLSITLKIPSNELTTIKIDNTTLTYLYTPDSGSLRTNIILDNVNNTYTAKIHVGIVESWDKWVSRVREINPHYIVILYQPSNLALLNGGW